MTTLKKLLVTSILAAGAGCTHTTVETPTLKLSRISFLQRVEIPGLAVSTNGTITLTGYTNEGGADAAAKIAGAAVSAAVTAAR
jgi:hypothetical protein